MGLCGLLFIIYDGLIKRRTHHAGEQAERSASGVICVVNQGIGSYQATAALDHATEREVVAAIKKLNLPPPQNLWVLI